MKTNEQIRVNFKQLGVDLTKRQISKALLGKGSLPKEARMFLKRGRFKNAAQAIQEG